MTGRVFDASRRFLMGAGAVGLVLWMGCRPGLGSQLASKDFAHSFTRRDAQTVRSLSTEPFRRAVWDRLGPEEFQPIARLMGHGRPMDVVNTEFEDERALIQMRTEDGEQYRLHMLKLGPDWYVEDVLVELEPAVFRSVRTQAEGVLAVRDFRRGLVSGEVDALSGACSRSFARETWERLTHKSVAAAIASLWELREVDATKLGPVQRAEGGDWSGTLETEGGPYVFYFVKEGDALVVEDLALPSGPPSLRARLREGGSSR